MIGHSMITSVSWPVGWRSVPLWSLFDRVKDVNHPAEQMLSVYRDYGVVVKDSRSDNLNKTAEDRSIYQLVDDSWLVFNRMKAWQGSVGVSPFRGIVSGHYVCFRPKHHESSRFLNWLLRSDVYRYEYARRSRGVRPGQLEIDNDELRRLPIVLPPLDEQNSIANFLDRHCAEIDSFLRMREAQLSTLAELEAAEIVESVRGLDLDVGMRPSGLAWLGDVAAETRIAAVSYEYDVALGKMLNSARTQGRHLRQYLRNTNVQWDRIDTTDLLLMDFPPPERRRYRVLPGDLLVCEGGEPGRAAIWGDSPTEMYYQKALHRVRSRGGSRERWLYYCLKAASYMNVFAGQGNLTTIAHLTGEQLKSQRFPFPDPVMQDRIIAKLDARSRDRTVLREAVERQIRLIGERRQAMISAAVTGRLDVATSRGVDL